MEKFPYEKFTGCDVTDYSIEKDADRKIRYYREASIYWQDKYMNLKKDLEVLLREIDIDKEGLDGRSKPR